MAIGDLDGDGNEDAVLWGNAGAGPEEQGQRPVIRVYWGSGTQGLMAGPEIDMRFDPDRPWYEVLDVSIERADSLVFLTAEDLADRDSPPPRVRRVRSGFITAIGKALEDPTVRSQDDLVVSGYVDDPAPAFVWNREKTVGEESRLVFGFVDSQGLYMPTLGSDDRFEPADSTAYLWEEESPIIQEAFSVDDGIDSEDMLVVTRENVGRTVGDAGAAQSIVQTGFGDDCARVSRGRAEFGTFYALASCEGEPGATLISSINAGEAPAVYPVELTGSGSPTDLEIADIGGDPLAPEIVTLEEGALLVYGDMMIGPPVFFDWDVSRPIEGYDLLAVGHFHGPSTHQIYLFSSNNPDRPPHCFEVDGVFRLVECE